MSTDLALFEVPSEPVPEMSDGMAILMQLPPEDHRRWELVVLIEGEEARRQHLSRPDLRPPTLTARAEALGKLGVRPTAGCEWKWTETAEEDGSVALIAHINVCRYVARRSA